MDQLITIGYAEALRAVPVALVRLHDADHPALTAANPALRHPSPALTRRSHISRAPYASDRGRPADQVGSRRRFMRFPSVAAEHKRLDRKHQGVDAQDHGVHQTRRIDGVKRETRRWRRRPGASRSRRGGCYRR